MRRWTDDQLRLVLAQAPTRTNAELLARALGRTTGSIEMIFRWALQSQTTIDKQPKNQTFARRIKRIAKESGWL